MRWGTAVARIDSIDWLQIYDSHLEPTIEYRMRLSDGARGRGASPHGETVGIFETEDRSIGAATIVETLTRDGILDRDWDQAGFDAYLHGNMALFGKNTCYALSLAFYNSVENSSVSQGDCCGQRDLARPRLCCNILNGGRHAYTNPVLSDFSEYLLVARKDDIPTVLGMHDEVQRAVHEALVALPKTVVNSNTVSSFPNRENRECVEFLLGMLDRLGLSGDFDLMIDAAASGLRTPAGYELELTSGVLYSSDEFCDYWLGLIRDYPLRFLEDPFGEQDDDSWTRLTTSQDGCLVIGDDYYCSDAARIEAGASASRAHGVIIKPNQAGSVTAVRRAIDAASTAGQIAIVSHRSVSTEAPFEAVLASSPDVPYIKIGPLITDYSSVIRLNEIIRLTAAG